MALGAGFVGGGEDDAVGVDLFVAEGDEGEDGVDEFLFLGGGGAAFCFEGAGAADFVLQLHDETLGGFLADAAQGRKGRGIARGDGVAGRRWRCC